MLDRITHFLGRRSLAGAAVFLVLTALTAALAVAALIARVTAYPLTGGFLFIVTAVTVIVATPIIVYAQKIIRELRESGRVLKGLTEQLVYARDEAERTNETRARFLANISHELRTPLNSIIGFSAMLEKESFGPLGDRRYLTFAEDIHLSSVHLLDIINNILDLSRLESGSVTPDDEEEVDVADAISACIRIIRPLADEQRLRIVSMVVDDGTSLVMSDRMLRQVLLNILSNAAKFTPEGGEIRVATEFRPSGALVISVSDTGVGMSAEEIKIAMTPFGRIENVPGREHAGTGLGLPLVAAMMELHGGTLAIDSVPGRGTTVSLLFPAMRLRRPAGIRRAS